MSGISSIAAGKFQNNEKTFQGQRLDDDLGVNWIQFKWRNHDPQIGRFIEIDPLTEDYVYNSTYAFSENKVTAHVELEGLEAMDFRTQRNEEKYLSGKITEKQYSENVKLPAVGGVVAGVVVFSIMFPEIAAPIIAADLFGVPSPTAPTSVVSTVVSETKKFADEVKVVTTETKPLSAIEQRAAKLSELSREGKDFTKAGKDVVKDFNKVKNGGQMKCEGCNIEVQPGQKSVKGVAPPSNEAHVDHIEPKAKGGSGTPDNGQVLCRSCNLKKGVN